MIIKSQKQWQHLKRLAKTGKLPHALLISGVAGLEFVIRIFGESMLQKAHPDFVFVEATNGEITIAQIRDCIWRLSLKPSLALFKIAIIDQAHLMNQEAQSAFLKTLEEPKGKTLLILITDYPDSLFLTIRSRVQAIKFHQPGKLKVPKKELIVEISKVSQIDLVSRFQYAEKISKINQQDLEEILTAWLYYFRQGLLKSLQLAPSVSFEHLTKSKKVLQRLQTMYYLISRTNVNRRLVLETLMLELEP